MTDGRRRARDEGWTQDREKAGNVVKGALDDGFLGGLGWTDQSVRERRTSGRETVKNNQATAGRERQTNTGNYGD